jgi:chemotaxis receptor (MCP) glutamine deamidase CheD
MNHNQFLSSATRSPRKKKYGESQLEKLIRELEKIGSKFIEHSKIYGSLKIDTDYGLL